MKLYATITSERATKGQGGKTLDISIYDENRRVLLQFDVIKHQGLYHIDIYGQNYDVVIDDIRGKERKAKKQTGEKINRCIECNKPLPEEWDGYCYKCNEQ